ncbi:agamous-like MADS-box protein AGL65 isoform X2 [Ricinus communis]|uniref:agamous-like MADS-box protein AGL65 isoform X2 n=1 Tax=Ricinus communis TaxID=3988 RepID=UPI00201AECA4|nr:agamous-like MADS-box protein AGL65 isoform X2 [Ricinus communis]
MGRRKLKILRLESVKARQVKYSKRKLGVLKKGKELATLCDVDLGLIMFSPSGKPSLYVGHDKELSTLLERLSIITVEEREQRREYTMKLLKKMYSKTGTEVDQKTLTIQRDEGSRFENPELIELKEKLAEKRRILREWNNPYEVDSLAQIRIMEEHLIASLTRVRNIKIQLWEKQSKA